MLSNSNNLTTETGKGSPVFLKARRICWIRRIQPSNLDETGGVCQRALQRGGLI
jgi:hypothetical protein